MPFPKILAPLLPNKHSSKQAKATEFVLSPAALPLSPPCPQQQAVVAKSMNEHGDPIIEVATTYEETSNSSQDTLEESTEVTENAVVLHEKPTTFDLCDNDLIIESRKETEDEQKELESFEKEMMRESYPSAASAAEVVADVDANPDSCVPEIETAAEVSSAPATAKANPYAPEIDFAPPAEFMSKDDDVNPFDAPIMNAPEEVAEAAMVALPLSPPAAAGIEEAVNESPAEFTAPIQAEPMQSAFTPAVPAQVQVQQPSSAQTGFIQAAQPEQQLPSVFQTVASEPEANFTMETTFRRTGTIKSKWRKMLSSAKGLVCKADYAEVDENNRIKALFNSKLESVISTAGQENVTQPVEEVPFVSAFDKQAEEDAKTPIYRRRNTSHTSLFHTEDEEPVQPYKSPLIGSDAYNIKLLCDQSFFGRW